MIKFICIIWYDKDKISSIMIYNSFQATAIANKINHSEDYLFSSLKKMENKNPLLEDDLEKDYHVDTEKIYDEDDNNENYKIFQPFMQITNEYIKFNLCIRKFIKIIKY